MEPIKATLSGREVMLSPLPFDARADVVVANSDMAEAGLAARQYVYYAALGMALPKAIAPAKGYRGDPATLIKYGRAVYNHLRQRGCSHQEVFKLAVEVFLAASDDIFPTVAEASDRADFSEAGEGPANS